MKKFTFLISAVLLCLIIFNSCNNTIYPIYIPAAEPDIPINNIIKDIPRYENHKLFTYYILSKQKQKQLKLSVPENGTDSLLIRIWYTYPQGIYQFAELVELHVDSAKTISAKYIRMRIFWNVSRRYEIINRHKDTVITPKSGWMSFMDTIKNLKITKLPTIEFIPKYTEINGKNNFDYPNDKLTISVEIATKKDYRFFQYCNLNKYNNIDEVNRMYRFELFMREQFPLVKIDKDWY